MTSVFNGIEIAHKANPQLSWEESRTMDLGLSIKHQNVPVTLDIMWYSQQVKDIIQEVYLSDEGINQYQNNDQISTKGIEIEISTTPLPLFGGVWQSNMVMSHAKTKFDALANGARMVVNPGPPCGCGTLLAIQREGGEVGTFFGPVFAGVSNGDPVFEDINGDGEIIPYSGSALDENADFEVLGTGMPSVDISWNHHFSMDRFEVDFQLWSQLGHSIANTLRLAFEPLDPGAINNFNRVNTSLAIPELQSGIWSSLYVEKADFLRLSFLRFGYLLVQNDRMKLTLDITAQNLFTITSYTGLDPEAILVKGPVMSNGDFGFADLLDVSERQLSPGITNRNEYPTARTFTVGVRISI